MRKHKGGCLHSEGLFRGRHVLLLAALLSLGPAASGEIRFRSGPVDLAEGPPKTVEATVNQLAADAGRRHVVLQFSAPITEHERADLAKAGVQLLSYLPENAYFASMARGGVNAAAVAEVRGMRSVAPIQREWKLDPRIQAGNIPGWAVAGKDQLGVSNVAVYVLFHHDIAMADAANTARAHGAVVLDQLESINGLVIELPLPRLNHLADEDGVQWIEWPLPRMEEINDSNRVITQANIVQAAPYGLNGAGVTVLVYDANQARSTHVDFQGRLLSGAGDASGIAAHATHVSCTIGGAGVANAAFKGMAPACSLVSYGFEYDGSGVFLYSNPGDMEDDYNQAISVYGADISNNSIGTNTETNGFDCAIQGDYGVTSNLIDTIVRGDASNPLFDEPFRVVWANGNERQGSRCDIEGFGDYYSTAPPAGSKNHIAVGALNSNDDSMTSFSSWGPVDDGRLKPDISAPGCQSSGDLGVSSCSSASDTSYTTMCGTSMASPTVCGLSTLLLQDFRAQFPGKPDFRNSTLKILLAHNAVDLGNAGPDYQFGYGSVRIQNTVDFMRAGNFLESEVSQGGTYSVLVVVDPGAPELKVTMAWDDYPATLNTGTALINDLDLRVYDPSSQQHFPWTLDRLNPSVAAVRTQANRVDNIEQVYVQNPAAGVWRVEVFGFNVPQGPQPFSLAASPLLVNCSTAGTVALNAPKYPCSATAGVQVIDCDLNTNDNVVESISINVASGSEPGGESVLLTETGAATADFRGTLSLSTTNSAGVLQVADGNTITATYVDADNGQGGTNVTVTDTASVDCTPPVITNVATSAVGPFTATVTFDTDEAANGTVRYGLSCGSLGSSASEAGSATSHSVALSGLQESTAYFYVVDAADQAGNLATNNNGGACFTFSTTDVPNYFTELYESDNDTDNLSLTFTPNASIDFYAGCADPISALPVDPSGGTTLPMSDDTFATVNLSGGATVSLYGTSYGTFYVGSNGYITFNSGDSTYIESFASHFNRPRVAALFDDLNPGVGGTVSWRQLADRAVVTWQNVPEYGTSNANTFQIELQFSGTIRVSYLGVAAVDGLAGLSRGTGQPADFFETDLSAMGSCAAPTCTDGIQNQGEDRIDCGGPCPPCNCTSDGACSDGLFCTGAEICDAFGDCQAGANPCPTQLCDEAGDRCVDCFTSGDCTGGRICCLNICITAVCSSNANCNDGNSCTSDVCSNPGTCSASCSNPPAACGLNDGCCPAGCTYLNDPNCCRPQGTACTQNAQCCSNQCKGGKNKTCR